MTFIGCGGAGETQTSAGAEAKRTAWISVDGYLGAPSIGIMMAQDLGYFEEEGLEMTLTSSSAPIGPINYVAHRDVDLGLSRQPQVLMAAAGGKPVISVAGLISQPTAAMIWLKRSGIDGIADLKGKTIAVPGMAFQKNFLVEVLERAGLSRDDVTIDPLGYKLVPALASGRVDAIFGGTWNVEGAALQARGLNPVIFRSQRLGIPAYEEQVLVARPDPDSEDSQLIEEVVSAVNRGTAAAVEHPGAAVSLIENSFETDPKASRKEIEAEVRATLPLFSRSGYMDPDQASELYNWMRGEGWIERSLSSAELLTNDYLPQQP